MSKYVDGYSTEIGRGHSTEMGRQQRNEETVTILRWEKSYSVEVGRGLQCLGGEEGYRVEVGRGLQGRGGEIVASTREEEGVPR